MKKEWFVAVFVKSSCPWQFFPDALGKVHCRLNCGPVYTNSAFFHSFHTSGKQPALISIMNTWDSHDILISFLAFPAAFCSTGMQRPAKAVCPASCRGAMACPILHISTFNLVSNGNFHSQPFQPKKQANPLPNLKSWSCFTANPAHLPFSPPPSWQLCLAPLQKETVWGKGLWYLYGSCLSHFADTVQSSGSFFWTTLQAKETPWAKTTQNISPLTNPKWKPFLVHNSEAFLPSWLQIFCCAVCQSPQSAGGSGTVRGGGWAEELFSEHSGNHSEGGRYFSIYKNAELAGFFFMCFIWYFP